MSHLAHVGEMLAMHARLFSDKIGASDLDRKMTFRVCVLAYNCLEWLELYVAAALAGVVVVPINFRLTGLEARYIIENCDARALVVQDELLGVIESVRVDLPVPPGNFVHFGKTACPAGYRDYEDLLGRARDAQPSVDIAG